MWIPGEPDVNDTLQDKVEAHLASFGERDRLLIGAEMTSGTGPDAAHIKRFQDISDRFATDWAAVFPYADHLVHTGALIGYTGTAMRAALERTVALNPKLANAWEHLYSRSVGRDTAQSDRALRALVTLEDTLPPSGLYFLLPIARLAAMTDGAPPAAAFDSVAAFVRRSPPKGGNYYTFLAGAGYPGRQLTLDSLLLNNPPRDSAALVQVRGSVAFAWAARGVWDSALVAEEVAAAVSPRGAPLGVYGYAITGAWLGGLSVKEAVARREAAVGYVAEHAGDSGAKRARGQLIWFDALLAIMQRDTAALAAQRKELHATLGKTRAAVGADRTLAAFQLLLRNKNRAAADSLAAIELDDTEWALLARDAFVLSIGHLTGAQLLLQLGDTAVRSNCSPGRRRTPLIWRRSASRQSPI